MAWMAFIWYWSSQSTIPIQEQWLEDRFQGWQNLLAHAAAFGILGGLLRLGLSGRRATLAAVALVSGAGAMDEWHQSFTPGRHVEVADWLVDTIAGAGGAALAARLTFALAGATSGRAVPRLDRRWALLGAALVVVLVGLTPLGRPARAEARIFVARAVPHRVQAYPAEVASAGRDVARRVRGKIAAVMSG